MRRFKVYVDTSVFGGTQDTAFSVESMDFFNHVRNGEYIVIISDLTVGELTDAPEAVRSIIESLPDNAVETIVVEQEAKDLASRYIKAEVLGNASLNDALHVAAATIAGADLILSWNFKHIVNFNRIRGFNSVNISLGYRTMTILSPMEVMNHEKKD